MQVRTSKAGKSKNAGTTLIKVPESADDFDKLFAGEKKINRLWSAEEDKIIIEGGKRGITAKGIQKVLAKFGYTRPVDGVYNRRNQLGVGQVREQ